MTALNASTVERAAVAFRCHEVDPDTEIAQRQPGIHRRRKLAVGDDDTVTGLPLQAGRHEPEPFGGVLDECNVVHRDTEQLRGGLSCPVHAQLELVVVDPALPLVAIRPPAHAVRRRLGDRRDAGVIEVVVVLDNGELVAGECGHLAGFSGPATCATSWSTR